MNNVDDIVYSPIVPGDELRKLIKKIMDNPTNRKLLDEISDHIVDLFGRHGITEEQVIVDAVYRKIRELESGQPSSP